MSPVRTANAARPGSERVRVRRFANRGHYDRETIDAILDSGLVCHVAFVFDGYPIVMPTFYWREGDAFYWHGSVRSRMMRAVEGANVCIAVTHLDGLVCARSAFNHSANYRSVTLLGTATPVSEPRQKLLRMQAMMESILPDRWESLRPVTAKELAATRIMSIPIDQVSAKLRQGPPGDLQDAGWPVWAGIIPVSAKAGDPEGDDELRHLAVPPRLLRPR